MKSRNHFGQFYENFPTKQIAFNNKRNKKMTLIWEILYFAISFNKKFKTLCNHIQKLQP